jgi:hypothetical protein
VQAINARWEVLFFQMVRTAPPPIENELTEMGEIFRSTRGRNPSESEEKALVTARSRVYDYVTRTCRVDVDL